MYIRCIFQNHSFFDEFAAPDVRKAVVDTLGRGIKGTMAFRVGVLDKWERRAAEERRTGSASRHASHHATRRNQR